MMIQGQLFPETYAKINAKNRLLKNIEFSRTYYGPTFTNPSTFFLSWNWYSKIILILFLPFQHICHILMLKNVYDFHRSPRTEGAFDECYQNHHTLIPFFFSWFLLQGCQVAAIFPGMQISEIGPCNIVRSKDMNPISMSSAIFNFFFKVRTERIS
jgi:hypothetical protein